jgi:hypothetical protein
MSHGLNYFNIWLFRDKNRLNIFPCFAEIQYVYTVKVDQNTMNMANFSYTLQR